MLSVRELEHRDVKAIADYWLLSDKEHLERMGVNTERMLSRERWEKMLAEQLEQDYTQKSSYCMIWELDGKAIGHSNVNMIVYGEKAYMHLHIWEQTLRLQGRGLELVKMSLPFFFKNLELQEIYCEPNALNEAPNKTLERVGFTLLKEYITKPGYLSDEQPVKLWRLRLEEFKQLY